MSYGGSASQDIVTKLIRKIQNTSVSCTKRDENLDSFNQHLKMSLKVAHNTKTCAKHCLHRQVFKNTYRKRKAVEDQRKTLNTQRRQKFASPSDNLLSPCSRKLNDHKSKLFSAKSQPKTLEFVRGKQNIPRKPNVDI
ncbi:BDM_1a_G0022440.mRNA.1.CDS.1 [Saccharomyces cerevisiae]|nr:BDM_1a_G0022440.mRNA.1.CDS.1 [Saccharomyces cerevisiae]CAI7139455.1 BDM_1a_G0022440.mRNA.1.CDS.1 [Saccharomyces cerevisiae]